MSVKNTRVVDNVSLKIVLLNVHMKLRTRYKKVPLWAFVRDICGVGSTTSSQICEYYGWDASQDAGKKIFNE